MKDKKEKEETIIFMDKVIKKYRHAGDISHGKKQS